MRRLFFFALLIPFVVNASNWMFIAASSNTKFYLETSSIQKDGDTVNFWIRENLSNRSKLGYLSSKTNQIFDCKRRERKIIYASFFEDLDNNGRKISQFSQAELGNPAWSPIPPDSVAEDILKSVCKTK